eukprot:TRINITY_DN2516_c1_g1_i3.p1 TRINITY_DN2516_c1_g1~~TRINITY_DN2516_c1_g1_i3.p1  ORF type:complete len:160 (+),score=30.45 TRINITY_DN2516_c1_g1_i3:68-547(+)
MTTNQEISDELDKKIIAANPANRDQLLQHVAAALASNQRGLLNAWNSDPISDQYGSILAFPLPAPGAANQGIAELRNEIVELRNAIQDSRRRDPSIGRTTNYYQKNNTEGQKISTSETSLLLGSNCSVVGSQDSTWSGVPNQYLREHPTIYRRKKRRIS